MEPTFRNDLPYRALVIYYRVWVGMMGRMSHLLCCGMIHYSFGTFKHLDQLIYLLPELSNLCQTFFITSNHFDWRETKQCCGICILLNKFIDIKNKEM